MSYRIAFIGYGLRSKTMLSAFRDLEAGVEAAAVCEPDPEAARAGTEGDPLFASASYYTDPVQMLEECRPDGVFIGTRCPLHTPMALKVLDRRLPLFLEKPVAISEAQLAALAEAGRGQEDRVVVSFPLRLCAVVQEMKRIVSSGILGRLTMVQAVNNVPYGSVYYHSWYRDPSLTGGLFLQKATHDIDYISYLTGETPVQAFAQTAKLYFKGDRPAGLRCPDCPDYRTCPESSYVVERIQKDDVQGDACCFAVDTGNEDNACAIFTCPSGLLISYSQSFVVKRTGARRGCRLIGTEGSAEFDFYTGEIRHDDYRTPQTVTHRIINTGNHFGGDQRLALAFLSVMDGKPSPAGLTSGLASAACCLAARRSGETGRPEAVPAFLP